MNAYSQQVMVCTFVMQKYVTHPILSTFLTVKLPKLASI